MHILTPEDNLEVLESYVIFRARGSKDGLFVSYFFARKNVYLLFLKAPVMGLWAGDPDHRQHLGDTLLG